MTENISETFIKIGDLKYPFKDSQQLVDYFKESWLISPTATKNLAPNQLLSYAIQVSKMIKNLGDNHMIPQPVDQLIQAMLAGQTMIFTDPSCETVLAFLKIFPWKKNDTIVALELGSLIVNPSFQGHHVGLFLVELFSRQIQNEYSKIPIISVVTADNTPSLNLFRKIGWIEQRANDPNNYIIDDVNILEDWGIPSSIFYYNSKRSYE